MGVQDYQTKGYSARGADMGRASDLPNSYDGPVEIRHVPIDIDGYDPGGAYWGSNSPLFVLTDDNGRNAYFNARNFDAARQRAQNDFPKVDIRQATALVESDISEMVAAYIYTAVQEAKTIEGEDIQDLDTDSLQDAARDKLTSLCTQFAKENAETLLACIGTGDCTWEQAGYDLWQTQHRAGVGFWETPDWPEVAGEALTQAARKLPEELGLTLNDRGELEIF